MTESPRPFTIDYESLPIAGRPHYPPFPVGVSIKPWGKGAHYHCWGHPSKNNCTWPQARKALGAVWERPEGLLFQNGKFDIDLAETYMEMPRMGWRHYHDTLFLLFLDDPHQLELGLKPSAERLLGLKPEERDAVGTWLLEHQPLLWRGIRLSTSNAKKTRDSTTQYYGAYVAYAPGDLVGAYANGDVERTEKLFRLLWNKNHDRGMNDAYDRERRLMPLLLDAERQGVKVDLGRLGEDVTTYLQWHGRLTEYLCKDLGVNDPKVLDSGTKLVEALLSAGRVNAEVLGVTPKSGKPRTDKDSLAAAVTDSRLLAMLKYRTHLGTCLHTFMQPWLATATASDGLIFTSWNQVKSPAHDGVIGTRTGRLSSAPNFQNIPKEFDPIFHHQAPKLELPKAPFKDLPALPLVRGYVIPWGKNEVLIDRDISQQEPRILAHFENGELMRQYQENPWIDFHTNAQAHLQRITGKLYDRKYVKQVNLGIIYALGIKLMSEKMGLPINETKEIKEAVLSLYPGLKQMQYDMKCRAAWNRPIRTWGGREYYCEPPKVVDGELRTFDYKLVNVLIQGSAADSIKTTLIDYLENKPKGHRFYVSVHDELLASVPQSELTTGMEALRRSMEDVTFDVPMLSEGKTGLTWSSLTDYDKKGVRIHAS